MSVPTTLVIDATQQTLEVTTSRDAISLRGRDIETGTPTNGEVLTYSSSASEWIYQSIDENVDDQVADLIQDSAGGGLTWSYNDAAGTLTPAYVGDSTLVTTGALNSGSITSGFTSIDVGAGAITTTGTVTGGVLAGTLSTAAQTNITSVGALGAGSISSGFGAINIGSSALTAGAGSFTTISGSTSLALASGATVTGIDNGSLGSSATLLATQGAIKTYVDAQVTAQDLDIITSSGNIDIDLDSESLTLTGGTGLASSASSTTVTFAIDSTVATLSGSQTLTNKTIAGGSNTLSAIANGSLTNSSVSLGGVTVALGASDGTPAFDLSDATNYGAADLTGSTLASGVTASSLTSVGTLTALQVDNLSLNGNTLSTTAGTDLLITPVGGQQIVLDGAVVIDAGVVTGATSITSDVFVGPLTGTASVATVANTIVVTDSNDSTSFVAMFDSSNGSLAARTDGNLKYNASNGNLHVGGAVEIGVTTNLYESGTNSLRTDDAFIAASLALASGATVTGIDNGSLGTSATLLATAGAIRTYVDAQITAADLDIITSSGNIDIDLDSESLTLTGGTGLASSATGTTVSFAIDSTVATLAGTQTFSGAKTFSAALTASSTLGVTGKLTQGSGSHTVSADADDLVVNVASGNGGITIATADAGIGSIYFANASDSIAARLRYDGPSGSGVFSVGSANAGDVLSLQAGNQTTFLTGDGANATFAGTLGVTGISTLTGLVRVGTNIGGTSNSGAYSIWGGLDTLNGGFVQVYGGSHASSAKVIMGGGLVYIASNLQATGTLTIGGASTLTGDATVGNGAGQPSMNLNGAAGGIRDLRFQTGGSLRWAVRADEIAETGSDAGSNFQIIARNDAGGNLGSALTITRASKAVSLSGALTVTGASTLTGALTVSSTGPNVIGGAADGRIAITLGGGYTSDGSGNLAVGTALQHALTGAAGDTGSLAVAHIRGNINTQTATESIGVVASLKVDDPYIVDQLGGSGAIAVAASVYIDTAPTEGTLNAALYVRTGDVVIAAMPTSDPSVAGALWSDSGTVKISAG